MPGLVALINSGVTAADVSAYNASLQGLTPAELAAVTTQAPKVGVGTDSGSVTGAAGCCVTPPFVTTGTPTSLNVRIEGSAPLLDGDVLTPVVGVNPCTVIPSPCTNTRTAISTSSGKVLINGRRPALVGDILNSAVGITVAIGSSTVISL